MVCFGGAVLIVAVIAEQADVDAEQEREHQRLHEAHEDLKEVEREDEPGGVQQVLARLKPASASAAAPASFEVRRILKAFVDAQWLADFDARLATYRATLADAKETLDE